MNPRAAIAAMVLTSAIVACSDPPESAASSSGAAVGVAVVAPTQIVPAPVSLLADGATYDAMPIERFVQMWHRPSLDGKGFYFDAQDPFGERTPMLVTDERIDGTDSMVRVLLPTRPNGASGWVPVSDVVLTPQPERIVVDLSSRTLRHYIDGRLVERFSVGVGTTSTPTTTGTFYVWVRVPQANPNGPYGAFALGLSGFSKVLRDWPGGGRLAIHGTTDPANRGEAVSHGCIRVYNPDMLELRHVPLGTPVIVKE